MNKSVVIFLVVVLMSISECLLGSTCEFNTSRSWFESSFLGRSPKPAAPPIGLEVVRHDHSRMQINKSIMNTPLCIGSMKYAHGLGTHATSEIIVRLEKGAKLFEAEVGVDNNYDTAAHHGSVIFSVATGGKELYNSGPRLGGAAPVAAKVELNGAREFVLRITDGGDGFAFDQADWAEASVTLEDGSRIRLDEMPICCSQPRFSDAIPFSFTYGGKPSSELLKSWRRTESKSTENGFEKHVITFTDPDTGIEVACEAKVFSDYPAVDWVIYLKNTGSTDTPIIENIRPLDTGLAVPQTGEVVLHRAWGSLNAPTDFLPIDDVVNPGAEINVAPVGGRSSNGSLPFFNLEWNGGGIVGAIGWSGQWALRLHRDGQNLTLQAGQQTTHLKLHSGESIRTPRMLFVMWQGQDRMRGQNLLRRLLLAHYVPKQKSEPIMPPISHAFFFLYNEGNGVTEENQISEMPRMEKLGFEDFWLDAGWFEGGWPNGAGSWVPKKENFPSGLKPVGDASHEHRMKFLLWFEPERVTPISRIWKEHQEWVMHYPGSGDGLFNLGDPKACEWLTNMLSKCIEDWGIDCYRNDFNFDPLPFWQAADAPDRQGMAEIRYVEGHYAMWDELLRRHPGLTIDNCASGGRRIDLETLSRSYPLWRSDTPCVGRAIPSQDQAQTEGLSMWVPLHSSGIFGINTYVYRSAVTTGTLFCFDTKREGTTEEQIKKCINEIKMLRPLYLGDYYPLTGIDVDDSRWAGWQFDRPELGKGFAAFFRRPNCQYSTLDVELKGLNPKATYEVNFVDANKKQKMTGAELGNMKVEIDSAPGTLLMTYTKVP